MEKGSALYRFAVYHRGRRIGVCSGAEEARRLADAHAVSITRPVIHPDEMLGAEEYTIDMLKIGADGKKPEKVSSEIYTTRIILRR